MPRHESPLSDAESSHLYREDLCRIKLTGNPAHQTMDCYCFGLRRCHNRSARYRHCVALTAESANVPPGVGGTNYPTPSDNVQNVSTACGSLEEDKKFMLVPTPLTVATKT